MGDFSKSVPVVKILSVGVQGPAGPGSAIGTAIPQPLGAATPGTAVNGAHEDHVHAMPSAADVGALGATAQATDSALLQGHNAAYFQVAGVYVLTGDSRLTDARPASDVSAWAKAGTKPSYTYSEVGAQSHAVVLDATPSAYSPLRLTPRLGVTRQEALVAFAQAREALRYGTLTTKKAAQLNQKYQYVATASTALQKLPDYIDLTAGMGDNTSITADKAYVKTVTALYDLTADAGRTTNLYSSFSRDTQEVTATGTITIGHTLEVVCTTMPYQGICDSWTVDSQVEVVYWEPWATMTSNGTGGTHDASGWDDTPLIPRLPCGTGQPRSSVFLSGAISFIGASLGSAWNNYNKDFIPYSGHSNGPFYYSALKPGDEIKPNITLASRGVVSFNPGCYEVFSNLTTAPGGVGFMIVGWGLVRCSNLVTDNANVRPGRLLLLVVTNINSGAGNPRLFCLSGQSTNAMDLFRIPGDPDYFEGMRNLR